MSLSPLKQISPAVCFGRFADVPAEQEWISCLLLQPRGRAERSCLRRAREPAWGPSPSPKGFPLPRPFPLQLSAPPAGQAVNLQLAGVLVTRPDPQPANPLASRSLPGRPTSEAEPSQVRNSRRLGDQAVSEYCSRSDYSQAHFSSPRELPGCNFYLSALRQQTWAFSSPFPLYCNKTVQMLFQCALPLVLGKQKEKPRSVLSVSSANNWAAAIVIGLGGGGGRGGVYRTDQSHLMSQCFKKSKKPESLIRILCSFVLVT